MESSPTSATDQPLPDYELLLQRAFFTQVQMVEVKREFGYLHFAFFVRAVFGSVVLLAFWDVCQIFLDGLLATTASWVFAALWMSFAVWSVTAHLNLIRAKKHARRVAEAKTEDQYPLHPERRGQVARESLKAKSEMLDDAKWGWAQPNS